MFWKGKRVFLTGHTGFKGAWLSIWLSSLGADVTGYALEPPTDLNLFEIAKVGQQIRSVFGDVRDMEKLSRSMREAEPEIVFHLAAQPLVRESYKDPMSTYEINVMGTVHVLECVRRLEGVKSVVNVTTDKCYENREWIWGYRETDAMGGYDPYSSSKGCSELVTAAYRNSFFNVSDYQRHGVALASARAGNVIGGGDWATDRLVPDCLKALTANEKICVRNPQAIRPWQHVLEPLSGYITLAEHLYEKGPVFAEGWNFGPREQDVRSVGWIVEELCRLWGSEAGYRLDLENQPHEAQLLKLDCSKAHAKLGWSPRWTIEDALDCIVEWTRAYQRNEDMQKICLKQIHRYVHGNDGVEG